MCVCNRYDVTSPGEAQRIAFARLFYHMPPFACEADHCSIIMVMEVYMILNGCLTVCGLDGDSLGSFLVDESIHNYLFQVCGALSLTFALTDPCTH